MGSKDFMNILITGGTGFLGASFVDVVKNISGVNFDVVARKRTNDNWNFVIGDLGSKDFLIKLLQKNYDKVFHFAWEGLPDLSDELCKKNYE
jgi:nucleoside-diphosphate-sugar epimerase